MNTAQTQQKPPFSREVVRGEIPNAPRTPNQVDTTQQDAEFHDLWTSYLTEPPKQDLNQEWSKLQTYTYQPEFQVTTVSSAEAKSTSESGTIIQSEVARMEKVSVFKSGQTELRFNSSAVNTEIRIPASIIKEVEPEIVAQTSNVVKTFEASATGIHLPPIKGEALIDVTEKTFKTVNTKIRKPVLEAVKDWWKEFVAFKLTLPKKETPEEKKKKEEEAKKSRNNQGFRENLMQLMSGARRREAAVNSMKGRAEQILTDIHANNKSNTEGILDVYDPTKIQRRVEIDDENAKEEQMLQRRKEENDRRIRMATKNKKKLKFGEKARADSDPNFASENPSNKKTALG